MKKEALFYIAIICTIAGLTLIGFGIGKIFCTPCTGTIIGLGVGLCATAIVLLKTFRRIDAYGKK
ncbi:MAG: hypothetical protein HJHJAOHD_02694 [Flavobacteriales bacterium]|nr:hypothetical protein [Flavobacteriales bacterium]WKZ76115.1 MAG: hypothetical protein QY303_04300 [Vicingaceae bacterium]